MPLKIQSQYEIPADTKAVAEEIFSNGNPYMQVFEHFKLVFQDQDFSDLFPADGQQALSPARLMMVLILQFIERLSDRQAAGAVRTRIDWKYLLCLKLTDRGFHYSVLSEFRARLLAASTENELLERLLQQFQDKGLLKPKREAKN